MVHTDNSKPTGCLSLFFKTNDNIGCIVLEISAFELHYMIFLA